MANRPNINKFLEYYSKPLSRDRVLYLNNLNCIEPEKVELYKDFMISLTYLIGDTFLGDDFIIDEDQRKEHFNWCWKKNIANFKLESLNFDETGEHYYYFYRYFYDVYYANDDKKTGLIKKILSFWEDLMSMDRLKTHNEHDAFLVLYKLQTKHFSNNFS